MNIESCIACLGKEDLVSVHEELTFDGYTSRKSSTVALLLECFNIEILEIQVSYAMCSACLIKLLHAFSLREQILDNFNSLSKRNEDFENEELEVKFKTEEYNVEYLVGDFDYNNVIDGSHDLTHATYQKSNEIAAEVAEKKPVEVSKTNIESSENSSKWCDESENKLPDNYYEIIAAKMSLNGIIMTKNPHSYPLRNGESKEALSNSKEKYSWGVTIEKQQVEKEGNPRRNINPPNSSTSMKKSSECPSLEKRTLRFSKFLKSPTKSLTFRKNKSKSIASVEGHLKDITSEEGHLKSLYSKLSSSEPPTSEDRNSENLTSGEGHLEFLTSENGKLITPTSKEDNSTFLTSEEGSAESSNSSESITKLHFLNKLSPNITYKGHASSFIKIMQRDFQLLQSRTQSSEYPSVGKRTLRFSNFLKSHMKSPTFRQNNSESLTSVGGHLEYITSEEGNLKYRTAKEGHLKSLPSELGSTEPLTSEERNSKNLTSEEGHLEFLTSEKGNLISLTSKEDNSTFLTSEEGNAESSNFSESTTKLHFLSKLCSNRTYKRHSPFASFNNRMQIDFQLIHSNCEDFYMFFCHHSKYKCAICKQQYGDVEKFKNHTRLHSIKDTEIFFNKTNFNINNTMIKVDISDTKCKHCKEKVTGPEKFRSHLSVEHHIDSNYIFSTIVPYNLNKNETKCVFCCKDFPYMIYLIRHMNEHYANYICSYCGKPFPTHTKMSSHIRYKHMPGVFKCKDHCDMTFDTQLKRDLHMRRIESAGCNCPLCPAKFKYQRKKRAHLAEVHGVKVEKYECEICQKKYVTAGYLQWHIRNAHLNERNHVCSVCGDAFFVKSYLKSHMVVHNGERPFHCEVCNKTFKRKSSWKIHMWKHEGFIRFVCQICGYRCVEKCKLDKHMKVHTKPKILSKYNKNKKKVSTDNLKKKSHSSRNGMSN